MNPKRISLKSLGFAPIVYLISLLSILAFFGKAGVIFELASHFRMAYVVILLCSCIWLIGRRQWKVLAVAVCACLVNVTQFQSFYSVKQADVKPTDQILTVLQLNVWANVNKNYKAAIDVVREKNPMMVGVIELRDDWVVGLEDNLHEYPYRVIERRYGGLALYSKVPIVNSKITYLGKKKRPHITAEVELNGKRYTVIVVHPYVPMPHLFKKRNEDFEQFAIEAKQSKNPVIVFGDFNCSPWSYYFQRLLRKSNLQDSEVGFGFQPTWFAFTGLPFIPIDHVLTSRGISVLERQTGPVIGSDHLPVFVKLSLP